MLAADNLDKPASDGVRVPQWLGPHDHPWIGATLDALRACEGRPLREWHERAREPLRMPAPAGKRRTLLAVLERMVVPAPPPPGAAAALRERVFALAQQARDAGTFARERVLAEAAATEDVLYLDLPSERPLVLGTLPEVPDLAQATNQALARAILARSAEIRIDVAGGTRAVLRQIALRRLLCVVRPGADGGAVVDVSGPFALFRRTTLYGRALGSLIPVLRGADRFTLVARCMLAGKETPVRLCSGDPIFPPGPAMRRADSRLEERFAADFARLAPDWDLTREPEPVAIDGTWIFPDFGIRHRRDRDRRWLLEVVGFWTPEYLSAKLDRLRRAGRGDLLVCIDADLGCGEAELADLPHVLQFRKRVDVAAVLEIIRRTAPPVQIERVGVRDLFIDFAGRLPATDPIHGRLAALAVGSPVELVASNARIHVVAGGGPVAALSGPACRRWLPRLGAIRSCRVAALVDRSREQSSPEWRSLLQVERWRLPGLEVGVTGGAARPADAVALPDQQG